MTRHSFGRKGVAWATLRREAALADAEDARIMAHACVTTHAVIYWREVEARALALAAEWETRI